MKTRFKIGICLLLAAGFAACDKDETPVVGQLKVEYINMEATFLKTKSQIQLHGGSESRQLCHPVRFIRQQR